MQHTRSGLTLIEVLVALAIIAVLLALLVPAVLLVRQSADTAFTANQMKQLALAANHYAGVHRVMPAIVRLDESMPYPSHMSRLLPMLGLDLSDAGRDSSGDTRLFHSLFVSPADPSADAVEPTREESAASYAANAVAFGNGRTLAAFTDGTSHTIAFGQHFRHCGEITFSFTQCAPPDFWPGSRRATFADGNPLTQLFRGPGNDISPSRPRAGRPTGWEPAGRTFQHRPAADECSNILPQGLHRGGMGAAMMDGSVRTIAPSVTEHAFWAAVTPNGREVTYLD